MSAPLHYSTMMALPGLETGSALVTFMQLFLRLPCSLPSNEAREGAEEPLSDMGKHAAAARRSAGLSPQKEPSQQPALSGLAQLQTAVACLRKALSDSEAQAKPRAAARRVELYEGR